ncbi:MAG: hypothetical protein CFH23_00174 [Alphaproteobacteria bacterium MarineAlpha6_Bin1]|mgnify:CR=1 FL=1|nr:MAG: hypothetical protein CFH23_00174 [Alphaproteobacteria bacterium MarineAlpha6_Bin1]
MFNSNAGKIFFLFLFFLLFLFTKNSSSQKIFNLVGDWEGENKSYSLEKGSRSWKKKITIFEQNERIFKGNFKYADGETNFIGVIRSNNKSFYWVSAESKGYINGEILNKRTIEVCYVEAYKNAAVGCAILKREK